MYIKNGSSASDRLEKAFFTFLEDRHYSKIKVSELIEEASVSRTTFYRHYEDIYDMFNKVCNHFVDELMRVAVNVANEVTEEETARLFDELVEKVFSQNYYINLFCGKNGDMYIFYNCLVSNISRHIDNIGLSDQNRFMLKFVCFSGMNQFLLSCIKNKSLDSDIVQSFRKIITNEELYKEHRVWIKSKEG